MRARAERVPGEPLFVGVDEGRARASVRRAVGLSVMILLAALALTAVGVFRWEDLPRLLAVLTGALGVVLGLVFMQVWRNRRTMITSEGVYRAGWWGGRFIPWSEVERVERVGDSLLRIRGARGSVDIDLDLVEDPDGVVAALSLLVLGPAAEALQRCRDRQ